MGGGGKANPLSIICDYFRPNLGNSLAIVISLSAVSSVEHYVPFVYEAARHSIIVFVGNFPWQQYERGRDKASWSCG